MVAGTSRSCRSEHRHYAGGQQIGLEAFASRTNGRGQDVRREKRSILHRDICLRFDQCRDSFSKYFNRQKLIFSMTHCEFGCLHIVVLCNNTISFLFCRNLQNRFAETDKRSSGRRHDPTTKRRTHRCQANNEFRRNAQAMLPVTRSFA